MWPWRTPRFFLAILALIFLLRTTHSKYAHGMHRSGKKLVGPPVLQQRHVGSLTQCLILCESSDTCASFNFNIVSADINCFTFAERACYDHQLVTDTDFHYFDIYTEPTQEQSLSFWGDPACVTDGYCSTFCSAEDVGDPCMADSHCFSANMSNPEAFACINHTCDAAPGFWLIRPGLALPEWMDWIVHPWMQTYKMIKPGVCSIPLKLRLGVGATVELKLTETQRATQTRLKYRITGSTTDLLFYNEEPHAYADVYYYDEEGSEVVLVSGADTTGMVNSETDSTLQISWCDGVMSIGPESNPTLVSASTSSAGTVGEIVYLAATSIGPPSFIKTHLVADPWIFEDTGTDADPIFSFGDTMVERKITPSLDVNVTYDCKADKYCNVFFRSEYPHMLTVYLTNTSERRQSGCRSKWCITSGFSGCGATTLNDSLSSAGVVNLPTN
ncbi:hypothetical protein FJT64_026458 [Amphibalanus amphitrite]|uniref:Apple domain-containing protein n=1 Tax=Amphibalanus amphitrite TaxID=1232801 RepID=A0A6A4W5G9_AMPAM|nr:hypothetical protein FJT64_026458 [Amphibalanus amphitrite]